MEELAVLSGLGQLPPLITVQSLVRRNAWYQCFVVPGQGSGLREDRSEHRSARRLPEPEGKVPAVRGFLETAGSRAGTYLLSGSSTISLIIASVVSMREAIEAEFWRAVRVTLVGSMTPALTRSSYSLVDALKP